MNHPDDEPQEKGRSGPLVLLPNEERSIGFDNQDLRQAMVEYLARKSRIHIASIGTAQVAVGEGGRHVLRLRGRTH